MTDFFIVEEIQKMIKGLPKPRLFFKKGVSVRGYFRPYMSLKDYTKAALFIDQNEVTPVTVRFSSMLGDIGTADTRRNIKCMAVKFHSYGEVYDMICQNIPVLMTNDINDLSKAADTYRTRAYFDGINRERFWGYISDHNASITFALMLYSLMGLADSFVDINMFSVNTYLMKTNDSHKCMVRFKWVPISEKLNRNADPDKVITVNTAEFIAGYDPDRAVNEIISRILTKRFPMFELHVQMIPVSKTGNKKYTDRTLLWSEHEAPYMCVGMMVLDQIDDGKIDDPELYFLPANTVEGIEIYLDEMSQIYDFLLRSEAMERGAEL